MDLLEHSKRAVVFQTRALRGSNKLVGLPREIGSVSSAAHRDVVDLIAAVDRHDNLLAERRRSARDERDVADTASWDRTQRDVLSHVLRNSLDEVKQGRAKTQARRDKILNPPPLTEGQHVLALRENEIRNGLRALSDEQRARVMETLSAPAQRDMLLALARDPTPLSVNGEMARGIYKAAQLEAQAPALAALADEDAGHDWSETSLTALADLVR